MNVNFVLLVISQIEGNGTNATDDLNGLLSDFWTWQMYMNPVSASQRGLTEYNDRMEQYGLDQFDIQKVARVITSV